MNLNDLHAELEARANDVQPSPAIARLVAVRGRARIRRRRQIAATTLIAAGCAMVIAMFPTFSALPWNRSAQPTTDGHPLEPFTFDDIDAGDPLVAQVMGAPGQSDVELRFTPTDTNLSIAVFCYLPDGSKLPMDAAASINGHGDLSGACESGELTSGAYRSFDNGSVKTVRKEWAAFGMVSGRESVLRVRLQSATDQRAMANPNVRIGVALYQRTDKRILINGFALKQDAESGGHDYRLAGYRAEPITAGRHSLTWNVPADRWPVFLVAGSLDAGTAASQGQTRVVAPVQGASYTGPFASTFSAATIHSSAGPVTVSVDQASGNTGRLLLAYYVRVD